MRSLLRRLAAPIAALFALLTAPAAHAAPAPAPAAAAAAPARPALWKVADADTTIYLFGTIHVLPRGIEWFDGAVAPAFAASDELVTEIVETQPAEMTGLVMKRAMLPKGQTLRGLLAPDQKAGLEAALAGMGIPAGAFDLFEPWYAALGLATLPLGRHGYAVENGVESALHARARALGRRRSALETAEFQLDLFDRLPVPVQTRYLGAVVEQLPQLQSQLAAMTAAWQRGDADELARLMNAEEDDPALIEALLTGRNRTWAGWIRNRLDTPGTVFVAVGAGHLAGAGSVQEQLARMGIASRRVQ